MRDRPKYVLKSTTRHGKVAYYYNADRKRRIRLPDDYGSPEFMAALEVARAGTPPTLDLRFAKYKREMTSRVGRVMVAAVRAARTRSRKRGWEFDLTADWALDKAKAQDFLCALTGIPFFAESPAKSKVHPFTPSLDRIDCTMGYTKENVRIVCWAINAMLLDWGEDVFSKVARRYRAHQAKMCIPIVLPGKHESYVPNNAAKPTCYTCKDGVWCGQEKCHDAIISMA